MNYIIKLRHCVRKESRKREGRGTVLYTDKVAVLAELGRYYKYRTAFN